MIARPYDEMSRVRRRRHLPAWAGPAALVGGAALLVAFFWLQAPRFDTDQARDRVINVVLPPPPPPPPPEQKPPEPEKKVLEEPTPQPPTPQPPAPTPPQPDAQPVVGDSAALTARVGAGPSNYGLQPGSGGGTRIGGPPGGGFGFTAYGNLVTQEVTRAIRSDPALGKGSYVIRLALGLTPEGRVTSVRVLGDASDRTDDLRRRLIGLTLSQRPPAGMPPVVRIEVTVRPSA